MCHFERAEALSKPQHEYIPKNSCLTNLLTVEDKVTTIMDSGDTVDLVILDFFKTFDSINHRF